MHPKNIPPQILSAYETIGLSTPIINLAIRGVAQQGKKITAIKMARTTYGYGLKEAKDWVEAGCPDAPLFEVGDRVIDNWNAPGTVLAVSGEYVWVKADHDPYPCTWNAREVRHA